MKLLQADLCSSYPLARAGGHRTVHSLLLQLSQMANFQSMALIPRRGIGSQLPDYDPRLADFEALGIREVRLAADRWIFDCGYPVHAVDRVENVFPNLLDSFGPDVVWSNCFASMPLLLEACRAGVGAVWYLHDRRPRPDHLRCARDAGVQLVAVSRFIADRAARESGSICEVVYPVVNETDYITTPAAEQYVTFINPRPVKGYEVFLGIPPLLPEVQFLVVEAWPLGDDRATVERQLAGFGNVRFQRQVADVREIYKKTRVLLVPSVVEEGGPRIVREAQLNGIPVLGSPRGGIPEMVGDGGHIVADYLDPASWAEEIRVLLAEPGRHPALSAGARANAWREELRTETIVEQFRAICLSAAKSRIGALSA
jgi:glycosyltransferase involved in cell wall biosynthesis